jgi:hypothetical protein
LAGFGNVQPDAWTRLFSERKTCFEPGAQLDRVSLPPLDVIVNTYCPLSNTV